MNYDFQPNAENQMWQLSRCNTAQNNSKALVIRQLTQFTNITRHSTN